MKVKPINIDPKDTIPVFCNPYPIPLPIKQRVKDFLYELLELKISNDLTVNMGQP